MKNLGISFKLILGIAVVITGAIITAFSVINTAPKNVLNLSNVQTIPLEDKKEAEETRQTLMEVEKDLYQALAEEDASSLAEILQNAQRDRQATDRQIAYLKEVYKGELNDFIKDINDFNGFKFADREFKVPSNSLTKQNQKPPKGNKENIAE